MYSYRASCIDCMQISLTAYEAKLATAYYPFEMVYTRFINNLYLNYFVSATFLLDISIIT